MRGSGRSIGEKRRTQGKVQGWLKICVALVALLMSVLAVDAIFLGITVNGDMAVKKLLTLMGIESYSAFHAAAAMQWTIAVACAVAIVSAFGCFGALLNDRSVNTQCPLAVFGACAMFLGLVIVALCACLNVFLNAQAPVVAKVLNRICADSVPQALKEGFSEKPATLCTNTTLARRLHEDATPTPSFFGRLPLLPRAGLLTSMFAHEVMLDHNAGKLHMTMDDPVARRLLPSTSEESVILRTCSRLGPDLCTNPCQLIDELCEEPKDFNPFKACICDREGPRVRIGAPGLANNMKLARADCPPFAENPMCAKDESGRHVGVYCMAPKPNLGEAAATSIVGALEACFVLPTADCSSRGGTLNPDCSNSDKAPCISQGPCIDPDSRSRLFVESRSAAIRFVQVTACLGAVAILASILGMCMCCELHTGVTMFDSAKMLTQAAPGASSRQAKDGLLESTSEEDSSDDVEGTSRAG